MPLFRRKPPRLPLRMPRIDGSSWPDRRDVERPSFAPLTLYQMGYREAFEPEAATIADRLVEEVLPMFPIDSAPGDAPYLRQVFVSAAQIGAGMERVVVAGGVQSLSMMPLMKWRVPWPELAFEEPWMPPTHVESPDAPTRDMSITVGWNTARAVGITREEMDAWALRSHQRAIAAIDDGKFVDEIVPLKLQQPDGSLTEFSVDEHPRRETTMERLAALPVLHPEIEGFSITAGNSSGTNDAAAAVTLVEEQYAEAERLTVMGTVKAWAAVGVAPRDTGLGAVKVIGKVLARANLTAADVDLWEINEAFASVPIAACREYGLDEEKVNFSGSGCSLGHPIAASGARMVTTLVYELQRRGGGIGVAAMCAGGGMGGAVVIEV